MGREATEPRAPRPRRQSGPDNLEPSLGSRSAAEDGCIRTCGGDRGIERGSLTNAGLMTLSLSSNTRESSSVSCRVKAKVPARAGVCSGRVPPRPPGPRVTMCQRPRPPLLLPYFLSHSIYITFRCGASWLGSCTTEEGIP